MEIEEIKSSFRKSDLDSVIKSLNELSNKYLFNFNKEILLISSRYNALKLQQNRGVISRNEYIQEQNLISNIILEIISWIEELDISKLRKKSHESVTENIIQLTTEFKRCDENLNRQLRLRMKSNIAKSIGDKFIQFPDEIRKFMNTEADGIICGISRKIRNVPEFGDLDVIESITNQSIGNYAKGNLTNAIAELIYSHKLQIGDDERIREILNKLKISADKPLTKNIERVEAALEYLIQTE